MLKTNRMGIGGVGMGPQATSFSPGEGMAGGGSAMVPSMNEGPSSIDRPMMQNPSIIRTTNNPSFKVNAAPSPTLSNYSSQRPEVGFGFSGLRNLLSRRSY